MSGAAYLHEFGVVHGDLKGVQSSTRNPLLVSLISRVGEHSHRRQRHRLPRGFWPHEALDRPQLDSPL